MNIIKKLKYADVLDESYNKTDRWYKTAHKIIKDEWLDLDDYHANRDNLAEWIDNAINLYNREEILPISEKKAHEIDNNKGLIYNHIMNIIKKLKYAKVDESSTDEMYIIPSLFEGNCCGGIKPKPKPRPKPRPSGRLHEDAQPNSLLEDNSRDLQIVAARIAASKLDEKYITPTLKK
jgi:hypothetical protein